MNDIDLRKVIKTCLENIEEVKRNYPETAQSFWCEIDINNALIKTLTLRDFPEHPSKDA